MTGGMYPERWWGEGWVGDTFSRQRPSCAEALPWEEPGTFRSRKEAKET